MSTSDTSLAHTSPAAMEIEDIAADWSAARRVSTEWPAERQAELDAWLAQSMAHRVAWLRIEATWRRTERLAALRPPMREPSAIRLNRSVLRNRTMAAVGLCLLTCVIVGSYVNRERGQLIETPKGGQERLLLADGSQVELNTNSAIRVDLRNRTRAIELLRGEAFFEVKHDAARPFVVSAAGHRIVDLGTRFVVRMQPQSLRVALVEGSARLESTRASSRQRPVVLTPGDVAIATADETRVTKKAGREISDSLAWQRGAIVFRNERLADAVAEFNRYGGPQLVVADTVVAKLRINGTFRTTGAEDFAGITHEIFGLHVNRQDGRIVLSR